MPLDKKINTHHPRIACILASGLSSRFGDQNKLLAKLNDKAIIKHVAQATISANFDRVYAVVNNDPALHKAVSEFKLDLIINQRPEQGQSEAITLAAKQAIAVNAASMTIILGDMPFITIEHLTKLHAQTNSGRNVVSHNGKHSSPPVLFQSSLFESLTHLEGDHGALAILKTVTNVNQLKANPALLRDIDTPQMLTDYS